LSVKLSREEAAAVVATDFATAPAGYGLARPGWIDVSVPPTMGRERWQDIREGVRTSYTLVALELALREAIHVGHRSIGTEHLLLGLVRDDGCSAARILTARTADRERVRAAVLREIAAGGDRPGPPDRRSGTQTTREPAVTLARELAWWYVPNTIRDDSVSFFEYQ
jgi:Clp amino terminal domain, pathogenicity island component